MTNIFMTKLIAAYDDAPEYAIFANKAIEDHFKSLPPSKSKIDPSRMGSKSIFYCKLRASLLDKLGPLTVAGHPEFNKLSRAEQLRFVMQSKAKNDNKWVDDVDVLPANIAAIKVPDVETVALQVLRNAVDVGKLREEVEVINFATLAKALMPALLEPEATPIPALVAALLLATGRRTAEILKTAVLTLPKEATLDGFVAIFEGQSKSGLFDSGPYIIALLAPFKLVREGLDALRKREDTKTSTTVEVNLKYAKSLNNYCANAAKVTPHTLRAVYAMATYEMLGDKRPTLIGHVSAVLGHQNVGNAAYYTRIKLINFDGPYNPTAVVDPKKKKNEGWISSGKADDKRIQTICDMMLGNKKITSSAVLTAGGGSMICINRVIANNKDYVNAHNASLEK